MQAHGNLLSIAGQNVMFMACADTMQPCIDYVDNPVNHTEPAVADGLSALRVCLEARMVLMSVLSRNNLTSLPAKTAGYSYISKFGATCRYQHLPPEHGETAPDHLTNFAPVWWTSQRQSY